MFVTELPLVTCLSVSRSVRWKDLWWRMFFPLTIICLVSQLLLCNNYSARAFYTLRKMWGKLDFFARLFFLSFYLTIKTGFHGWERRILYHEKHKWKSCRKLNNKTLMDPCVCYLPSICTFQAHLYKLVVVSVIHKLYFRFQVHVRQDSIQKICYFLLYMFRIISSLYTNLLYLNSQV